MCTDRPTGNHVPDWRRREYTDARWLQLRMASAAGSAAHHVRAAMRSSRAALVQHVAGSAASVAHFGLQSLTKRQPTGNMLERIGELIERGAPS
ncbi:hypothetical protein CAE01nite_20450 [Cellulomonas aerilata]|uniref:Uncharacterized protein n=2 Tax=Cellulomonas aerilata TaxID=515326 RepID=A0A512DDM6_9CELL|nr:hypothetical protein CAE01nite_20450 [Cellulomonas aerilata]